MKLNTLSYSGLRGSVIHYYLETDKGSVWFAFGAEWFYQYNCILSNKEKLAAELNSCNGYNTKEVSNIELEAMIDEWCTTGDRWRAEELKKKMEEPAAYIIYKERQELESQLWKTVHAWGKNPSVSTEEAYETAKQKVKENLDEEDFKKLMKKVEDIIITVCGR